MAVFHMFGSSYLNALWLPYTVNDYYNMSQTQDPILPVHDLNREYISCLRFETVVDPKT